MYGEFDGDGDGDGNRETSIKQTYPFDLIVDVDFLVKYWTVIDVLLFDEGVVDKSVH